MNRRPLAPFTKQLDVSSYPYGGSQKGTRWYRGICRIKLDRNAHLQARHAIGSCAANKVVSFFAEVECAFACRRSCPHAFWAFGAGGDNSHGRIAKQTFFRFAMQGGGTEDRSQRQYEAKEVEFHGKYLKRRGGHLMMTIGFSVPHGRCWVGLRPTIIGPLHWHPANIPG
ncbi:hypothetical protein DB346_22760 [Verrucomicrobia bacterium LW23]|nr:hypothetical protein DB346_22760 [Verrucomicrobia bacterium LW23]